MKKIILLLIFTSIYSILKAQSFAIINDKDGFVNVRKDSSIYSPIVGKIYKDFVFGYDPDIKSKWVNIYKQDNDENKTGIEGYVYINRILPLFNLKSIKNIKWDKSSGVAKNDSLTIIIASKSFNPKKHKLKYDNGHQLVKIDGSEMWGTDGEMPKSVITLLKVIKNGTIVVIPSSAFHNLFEPSLKTLKVYLGFNNTIYIEMDNSDGAGAYTIIWTIKNNQYFARYIDNSNA